MEQSVSNGSLQLQADSQYNQYLDAMQKMHQVVNTMRENPQSPSQVKPGDDSSVITHVVFQPEGGILTYLARYDLPFRGFPFNDTVQQMDELKKLAKIIFQKFVPYIKKASLWGKIRFISSVDHFKKLAECYLSAYGWHIRRNRLKPTMYCQPAREMWKVIDTARDVLKEDEMRETIRDGICMFLEFDNAYRFRAQDILPELNKEYLEKNPVKEIGRLFDLMAEREILEKGKTNMAEKWKMAKELICLFLRFSQSSRKAAVTILSRLNMKEIEPSKEDRYYCEFRKDYKFGFMEREHIPIREIPKGSPMQVDNTIKL